jgi:DNA-nicking Smr family endonuclease
VARLKDPKAKDRDSAVWQAAMRDVRPLASRKSAAASPPSPTVAPSKKAKSVERPPAAKAAKPARPAPAPPADISHGRAAGIDRRSAERLSRGRRPIEGRLDLHGMTQPAAIVRLAEFIARAESSGKRCVLVITGKGLASGGVLRDQVPRWLNLPPNRARVLAFDYAQPQHGGSGALYVLLKRRRTT